MSYPQGLQTVFGESFNTNTAQVLNQPSGLSKEQAATLIKAIQTPKIIRDLAASAAGEIAIEIQAHAMRPADFATLPDLASMVAEKIKADLSSKPDIFEKALIEFLKLKG